MVCFFSFFSQPLSGSQIRHRGRIPGSSGDQGRMPCLQEAFSLLAECSQELEGKNEG